MTRVSQYDRDNIDAIMSGHGDWMSARILRLLAKADPETLAQFRLGFPDHVALFQQWMNQ